MLNRGDSIRVICFDLSVTDELDATVNQRVTHKDESSVFRK